MRVRGWRVPFFACLLLLFVIPLHAQDTGWSPHLNHTFHFQFELPNDVPLIGQTNVYQDADLYFGVDTVGTGYERSTLAGTCDAVARVRQGRGQIVSNSPHDYCLIKPNDGIYWAAIIQYPLPVTLTLSDGNLGTFSYLLLVSTEGYIKPIAESVAFPVEPPARLFVRSALELLQTFWYYRRAVDWGAVEDEAVRRLTEEPSLSKSYQALQTAIQTLRDMTGDQHLYVIASERASAQRRGSLIGTGMAVSQTDGEIFLIYPDSPAEEAGLQPADHVLAINGVPLADFTGTNPNDDQITVTIQRPGQSQPQDVVVQRGYYSSYLPSHARDIGNIGYLETFGFDGTLSSNRQYAADTQEQIREADRNGMCGWVVDTRRNLGGRFAPMFTGVGPLLGNRDILQLVDTHAVPQIISYNDGDLHEGPSLLEEMVDNPYTLQHSDPPIALLVSRYSASAGEMTPMLFLNRPKAETRIFGEPTVGLTSAVHYYDLYDGGKMQITTHLAADRSGQTYPGGLVPDVGMTVDFDPSVYGTDDDPVLQAAVDWLNEQPECAP